MGRAADAGAHAGGDALRHLRDRHEPSGRDPPAGEAGAAARRDRHDGRAGASRLFRRRGGDRRSQGGDLRGPGAGRHGDPQPRQQMVRPARRAGARARRAHRLVRRASRPPTFGSSASRCRRTARACRRGSSASRSPIGSARPAGISCRTRSPCSPPPMRSAPTWRASMLALGRFRAPKGRGERMPLTHPAGPFTLIDESYNANPASMRAALGAARPGEPGGPRPPHRRPRRHAGARRGGVRRSIAGWRRRSRSRAPTSSSSPGR